MKQTAVEWQFEQLFNSFEKFNNGEYTFSEYLRKNLEIREQAKEMEKQRMIAFAKYCLNNAKYLNFEKALFNVEEYYQIFKSE
jgi:hypothetical protein